MADTVDVKVDPGSPSLVVDSSPLSLMMADMVDNKVDHGLSPFADSSSLRSTMTDMADIKVKPESPSPVVDSPSFNLRMADSSAATTLKLALTHFTSPGDSPPWKRCEEETLFRQVQIEEQSVKIASRSLQDIKSNLQKYSAEIKACRKWIDRCGTYFLSFAD